MADAERLPRIATPAGVMRRIADAVRPHGGTAPRRRAGRSLHQLGGPLDRGTLRDIGARREYQEYASSAAVTAGSDRRLLGHLSRF